MKVLIISAFPPDPAPEANHALHLSEHLAEFGLAVHVLCKKGSIAGTHPDIVVHPVIDDWTWSDLPRLIECLTECRPDVVLLLYIGWVFNHEPMITFLPTVCNEVLPGVPCVTQFENVDEGFRPRSLLAYLVRKAIALWTGGKPFDPRSLLARSQRKAMALWAGRTDVHRVFGTLLRGSARVIFLSNPHRAKVATHYPEIEEKSFIVPPPPLIRFCADDPTSTRKVARDAIGADDNDFVLIYWGYIYPGKGVETLLRAFRIVCSRTANIRLVIVGGILEFPTTPMSCADYFNMVRELPEELGIAEQVTWTGHFDWDSDIGSRYLHAGDACVLPFDYGVTLNNSSLAAASTHGLPVIVTELPEGREEVLEHGRNVYLCPARNPEKLADAIQLISDHADLRERLRVGILRLVRDWYGWDSTTRRLVGVLKSAVSGRGMREHYPETLADNTLVPSRGWTEIASNGHAFDEENVPLVSVIVAVYNVAKYLSQCLDSLIGQTLKNIEIIVVNDASEDNSLEIAREYQSRYPHLIRVIDCESNKGLASVRNIGMSRARGEYVGFTDGDDWADIRMCELLCQRARKDDSDVLIADATVFDEQSKTFGAFFDQHIRQALNPRLRRMPFDLPTDSRILLLEPVAWTKLYKRSFLQKHDLKFEDGMNSYEDICFHFSVLLKATRISLLDDALSFYRQNRAGQISGRTSRKIFEVFAVFDKIRRDLAAWDVSAEIWALFVKVQVRQFDWLLRDRVQPRHKREFLASVTAQLRLIPDIGFRHVGRHASPVELAKLFCMRRNWFRAYEQITGIRWPLRSLYVLFYIYRLAVLKCQSYLDRLPNRLRPTGQGEDPLVKVWRVEDQTLVLSQVRGHETGTSEAVRRMAKDYYLTRTAVFREGDTVVDVGAHVGVVSIYLAKKYPFIKVYAIEPDAGNHHLLKRNIELNRVKNVTVINNALSGDGETLEQLFREHGIRHCRVLKITAPGAVQETLEGFTKSGYVDLLCGEVDLEDWSRSDLEVASWRIARQHFWRTIDRGADGMPNSWLHQMPTGMERPPATD